MATVEERIATLETKLKQAKAQKQKIEARKRLAESKAKRATDTRKKILIGAVILEKIARGELKQEFLLDALDAMLTRENDRALFDLPTVQLEVEPQKMIDLNQVDILKTQEHTWEELNAAMQKDA